MKQQTAVEYLLSELEIDKLIDKEKLTIAAEIVGRAKQMEKEQSEAAYNKAKEEFMSELDKQILDFEHDYNRTSSQHKHFGGALFALNRLKFYLSQSPIETYGE